MEFLVANGGALIFWLFALLMVVSAILVVTLRNPMYGAIALLVSFLSVAVLFLLQHAEFLAGVQVFVYGGGIMVLFLFVIMLVNLQGLRESSRFLDQLPVALLLVIVAVTLFGLVVASARLRGHRGAGSHDRRGTRAGQHGDGCLESLSALPAAVRGGIAVPAGRDGRRRGAREA